MSEHRDESMDVETLERRLRDSAATIDAEQPPLAPPIGSWPQRLRNSGRALPTWLPVRDPLQPSLAELLMLDQDDATFVESTYQHLFGRAADEEGREHYLDAVKRQGRLHVLASLYEAPECLSHCAAAGKVLPRNRKLPAPRRLVRRCGLPAGLRTAILRGVYAGVTRLFRHRWTREALQCRQQMADEEARDTRRLLVEAVLELEERQRHISHRQEHDQTRQRSMAGQVAELRRRMSRPSEAPVSATAPDTPAVTAPPSELDAYYLAFEDAFRGDERTLYRHLEQYRGEWLLARQAGDRALDLGCGRGEWLKLLADSGFVCEGVDLNATMVEHCQIAGFNVKHQDAIAALADRESESLALISGFHIAEHLPFEALFQLVSEARRVLVPGGVLILETPNPENLIVASHSFYHDLTHRNPLTPATFEFLLDFHGFARVSVKRFNPPPDETRVPGDGALVERLNHMLCAPMDYAVVGVKGESAGTGDAG
ncbi:class I SAM-dependent methyltransferase [Halomonas sabkhae]|uniref:class I SAM-dependent methyltransferase n=1 Tax=Halomonas sabkhae TaxID=626223 RepID=UPI0025B2C1BD|nr:class I SAM-dependent methyltransferase [Halomonas sabkhae]MDN3524165.1 class I SAM-dependent methyltransferase [Halomonas sabkhae]